MKRFYLKLVILTICTLFVSGLIWCISFYGFRDVYKNSYQKGYGYQYNALENADSGEKKVIVIGGSYMTFATDTEQLSNMLGIPVYTLGIHSGMGMDYILESALKLSNPGDIIVFSFLPFKPNTYGMELIQISLDGDNGMFWDFFKEHPLEVFRTIGPSVFTKFCNLLLNYVKYGTQESDPCEILSVYDARAFNQENGNLTFERNLCEAGDKDLFSEVRLDASAIEDECVKAINHFKNECDMKGVSTYLIYAPVFEKYYTNNTESDIIEFQIALENKIDIPLIADVRKCLVPREYIYNGALHMNDKGKKYYTDLIYYGLNTE